jgi:hypothetical protein
VAPASNKVIAFGDNSAGQTTIPANVEGAYPLAVAAGHQHSCAWMDGGYVRCWGLNDDGQATVPGNLGTAWGVTAGRFHTCAKLGSGQGRCWGANASGQSDVPTGIQGTIVEISAGGYHNCKFCGLWVLW